MIRFVNFGHTAVHNNYCILSLNKHCKLWILVVDAVDLNNIDTQSASVTFYCHFFGYFFLYVLSKEDN